LEIRVGKVKSHAVTLGPKPGYVKSHPAMFAEWLHPRELLRVPGPRLAERQPHRLDKGQQRQAGC
jgi:hypothetical protein